MRIIVAVVFSILVANSNALFGQTKNSKVINDPLPQWNHPYHKTVVMKMLMAVPDGKGGTIVYTDI